MRKLWRAVAMVWLLLQGCHLAPANAGPVPPAPGARTDAVVPMALRAGETLTASGSPDGQPGASNANGTDRPPVFVPFDQRSEIIAVAFSPDGKMLGSLDQGGTAVLWSVLTGRKIATLKAGQDGQLAFSPDGRILATTGQSGTRLWDAHTGRPKQALPYAGPALVFSKDGTMLAVGGTSMVGLWDLSRGRLKARLRGIKGSVWSVAFSPDGDQLAAGSEGGSVALWSTATGSQVMKLRGHAGLVLQVAFTPDGRALATASTDSTACIWSTRTGKLLETLRPEGADADLWSMAMSPDGKILATGGGAPGQTGDIKLFRSSDGHLLKTMLGHRGQVQTLEFSPNGQILASGSNDCTARLWDIPTGRLRAVLRGHLSVVTVLSFSPDGRMLATGSADHSVKLWNVATGSLVRTMGTPVAPLTPLTGF